MEFLRADIGTFSENYKTVEGDYMKLVAIQKSRRTKRKGRTKYIYHRAGTNKIFWNRSRHGPFFMSIATDRNMKLYFDIFVKPPLTPKEKEWLNLYDYELLES